MRKGLKTGLSLLVVLFMLAGMMPVSALAEETGALKSAAVQQEGIDTKSTMAQAPEVTTGNIPTITGESISTGNTNLITEATFANGAIADRAETRGEGVWAGWCKGFVNDVVREASNGSINLYGYQQVFDYFGDEISSADAVRGDIIQITPAGSNDNTAEAMWNFYDSSKQLHTAIILSNNGGGNFTVIDSNSAGYSMSVHRHGFNPYTSCAGSIIKIWRLGNVTPPPPSDTTPPTITNVQITDVNAEGFTVRCNVSDNVGVTAVRFPTWTNANGQDDLIWHENGINGNEAAYRVQYSDHKNERGDYTVHIYAYDAAGNQSNTGTSISIDAKPPVISNVEIVDQNGTGYTVKLKATDESGIDRVQFPTWTTAGPGDGRDDLLPDWPTNPAARGTIEGDTVTFRVNDSAHNFEKGEYVTHIYAYDKFGNATASGTSIILENSDTPIVQEYLGSHEYLLFDDAMNWGEAKVKAEALGGHLVTITSQEEQSLIEKMMQSGQREAYFIGGTDEGHEGTFTWITGEVFGLAKWAGGQPDNYEGKENCLEILKGGYWNDNSNTAKRGFIVEKESVTFSVKSFIADKASGQPTNTAINLTAAGSDGTTPYQYKFYYMLGSTAIVIRDFSTTDTATFKPTLKGDYTLYVEVKDAQGHSATKSMLMKINDAGGGGSESKLISYLGKDSGGNYYRYSTTEFNNSFLAYQINPALASAKMYQQYLNSQCKIVGLEDQAKGYMDYNATASACLKSQIWGQTFDINVYFASSDAKVFEETVENVRIVDKDGNIS